MRRNVFLSVIALCLCFAAPAWTADKQGEALVALEQKLHGEWVGLGGCVGNLTFRANGTFEHRSYGPGRYNSAGTWAMRWDGLPPTLILTYTTTEAPNERKGWTAEVKLVELDGAALAYKYEEGYPPTRFERKKKK